MAGTIVLQKTAAELWSGGAGLAGIPESLRVSQEPRLESGLWADAQGATSKEASPSQDMGSLGSMGGGWGHTPCRSLLTQTIPDLCLSCVQSPSHLPFPYSATWTSPLTWTSRASCASCPAPLTTGCAEATPGFSHPGRAGPAWAQGLRRS